MPFNPQISISAAPGITGYLRLALYEATSPLTEVASSAILPPPHDESRQIQFIDLSHKVHLAKLFITDALGVGNTVIANFSLDPKTPTVDIKAPLFIEADVTPGFNSGTNEFTDPAGQLTGWDYTVDIRGFGRLKPDEIEYLANGYRVSIPGYVLQPNELHIITFDPHIEDVTGTERLISPVLIGAISVITDSRVLVSNDSGKLLWVRSNSAQITLTLPGIEDVAEGKMFYFSSEGGMHKNVTIKVPDARPERIVFFNQYKPAIHLGQCEELWLIKYTDGLTAGWKVVKGSPGMQSVGELFYSFDKTKHLNAVHLDGSLLSRFTYPRLWEYVSQLPANMITGEGLWLLNDANKGKFSTGDTATNFRLPKLSIAGFLKMIDGIGRLPGSYEEAKALEHSHLTGEFESNSDNNWRAITAGVSDNETYPFKMVVGEGTDLQTGSKVFSNANATKTGKVFQPTGENLPKNVGAFPMMRI